MAREKEYQYRVLVYPNITKKYNEIMKDSYIVLLPKVLKEISKINKSVHFTILNPIHLYELDETKDELVQETSLSEHHQAPSYFKNIKDNLYAMIDDIDSDIIYFNSSKGN